MENFKVKGSFEIVHNAWAACVFPEKYPTVRRWFVPGTRLDDNALDELHDALCSEFTGYIYSERAYYSAQIMEGQLERQQEITIQIFQKNAHHVRSVTYHRRYEHEKAFDPVPIFQIIADNCSNLQRIDLMAIGEVILKLLPMFANTPKVSSVALCCDDDKEEEGSLWYEADSSTDSEGKYNWVIREVESVMRQFEHSPALELMLNFIPDQGCPLTVPLQFPTFKFYEDSEMIHNIEWFRDSFEPCRSLKAATVNIVVHLVKGLTSHPR